MPVACGDVSITIHIFAVAMVAVSDSFCRFSWITEETSEKDFNKVVRMHAIWYPNNCDCLANNRWYYGLTTDFSDSRWSLRAADHRKVLVVIPYQRKTVVENDVLNYRVRYIPRELWIGFARFVRRAGNDVISGLVGCYDYDRCSRIASGINIQRILRRIISHQPFVT